MVPAKWSYWDLEAALVPAAYVQAVERAGGRALLVPPASDARRRDPRRARRARLLRRLRPRPGALRPGSARGDLRHRPQRDDAELALLARRARARHAGPRDLPREPGAERRPRRRPRPAPARGRRGRKAQAQPPGIFADHDVDLVPGTRIQSLLGDRAPVKSHHHQGFGRLGAGLQESARADDGTIEAVEDPAQRFAVGVLWHPEAGEDFALFQGLVDEARRYAEERR